MSTTTVSAMKNQLLITLLAALLTTVEAKGGGGGGGGSGGRGGGGGGDVCRDEQQKIIECPIHKRSWFKYMMAGVTIAILVACCCVCLCIYSCCKRGVDKATGKSKSKKNKGGAGEVLPVVNPQNQAGQAFIPQDGSQFVGQAGHDKEGVPYGMGGQGYTYTPQPSTPDGGSMYKYEHGAGQVYTPPPPPEQQGTYAPPQYIPPPPPQGQYQPPTHY